MEKIKAFEEKHECLVYAVTHEFTESGELYDFLIITDYPEEWTHLCDSYKSTFYVSAYVWNKTDEWCSEFGTIGIQSMGGGIRRIA